MSLFEMTKEMKEYFGSLPKNIQQELVQSGASATSLNDLKNVVAQLTGENNE